MATQSSAAKIVPNAAAKSGVWVHFGFPGNAAGTIVSKQHAVCHICNQDMSYKNNTTNLFSHLECHHREEYAKLRKTGPTTTETQQPSIAESFAHAVPLGASSTRHKQLVDAVGMFIIRDLRPLSVVEGEGFCRLMTVAEPRFKLPSRTHFSQAVIPTKYVEVRREMEAFLHTVQHCSVTTDLWTAKYQVRSYMSLTCHAIDGEWVLRSMVLSTRELPVDHTAENLSFALTEVMTEWDIRDKVVGSSTDNAKNIVNAMKCLDIFNMPCVGHTLQLSVLKSFELNAVSKMLSRLRKIAGHFHRSSKASSKLRDKQQLLGLPTHKLLGDCVTRWGSTYAMLNRFIEQQQAICAVFLEDRDARQFMPSDDEISAAEELVAMLEVFHSATEIVSGEKYPTLGIVLPLLHKLLYHTLAGAENDNALTKRIKQVIRDDLKSRYQDDVVKKKLSIAMYLDPRFKAMPFLDDLGKDNVRFSVKLELIELIDAEKQKQAQTEPEPTQQPPQVKKEEAYKFF